MTASGWHRKTTNDPASLARKRQYNSKTHKAHRKTGQAQVDAGTAHCWRCGHWIPPGSTWHVGHDDHDRTITRGTECAPCNLKAAASKGARVANARRKAGLAPRRQQRRASRAW